MEMVIKDEEYLKRNILITFRKQASQYKNRPYYRFIGLQEYETLLQKKIIYFTNPVEWKLSNTGDPNETYFEDWFYDENNIASTYRMVKNKVKAQYKQYCSQQAIMGIYSEFVAAAALLQQKSFCYCITEVCSNRRMVAEYHKKYQRNVIVKFKNDFYTKLSIINDIAYVPLGTYLYADVMPMVYVNDLECFIEYYICNEYGVNDVAKNAFDYGAFLKHSAYSYEQETRIKLRIHLEEEYGLQELTHEFYVDMLGIENDDEIVKKSMLFILNYRKKLNEVFEHIQDKIKKIGDKECFELNLMDIGVKDIVDCIILHSNASSEEKECVYKLARLNAVDVKEVDFNYLQWFEIS